LWLINLATRGIRLYANRISCILGDTDRQYHKGTNNETSQRRIFVKVDAVSNPGAPAKNQVNCTTYAPNSSNK